MKHDPQFGSWIPAYLKALESGVRREVAYRTAGVCRQSVWEWKQKNPGFAHEEQMARDRGSVERLINQFDAEEVPSSSREERNRAYHREWARRRRERDPEAVREYQRRWRAANRKRMRANDRKRRRAKRIESVLPCRCEECGETWLPIDGRRKGRFCSKRCANKWHGSRRTDRNRGVRNMQIGSIVLGILTSEPWLTRAGILKRAPGLKPGSLATKLSVWVKEGVLVRRGRRGWRYAMPDALDSEEAA